MKHSRYPTYSTHPIYEVIQYIQIQQFITNCIENNQASFNKPNIK